MRKKQFLAKIELKKDNIKKVGGFRVEQRTSTKLHLLRKVNFKTKPFHWRIVASHIFYKVVSQIKILSLQINKKCVKEFN